jgi:biotin carboxylase
MSKLLLVMRKGYRIHQDHIQTIRQLGISIHLLTQVDAARNDPRFQGVTVISGHDYDNTVRQAVAICKENDIGFCVTFQETDIEICSRINHILSVDTVSVEAAAIGRDKSLQRKFLVEHGVPCPEFRAVGSIDEACKVARDIGYPLIVKPTRAASSSNVYLVKSETELRSKFIKIYELMEKQTGNFYESAKQTFALLEEFLPGDEVTVDGVIIDSQFYLGGIHNKKRMPGPFFEEDLYSLPFKRYELEDSIAQIACEICKGLGLQNSLFNAEIRQDISGKFKVVEFSPRISGGHVYRNIRDVYQIDLVAAHIASLFPHLSPLLPHFLKRTAPQMCTCIKFVYRSGQVMKNNAGDAALSPYFGAYYPTALSGNIVRTAPKGFDITGLLSIKTPFRELTDVTACEDIAEHMEQMLALELNEI